MDEISIQEIEKIKKLCALADDRAKKPTSDTRTGDPPTPPSATGPQPHLTKLDGVTPEDISWLWPGRLAFGKLTLLAGDPGLGKSRLAFDITSRITTGGLWPDRNGKAQHGKVLLMAGEDGLADVVRPCIDKMGGDPKHVEVLDVADNAGTRPLDLSRDLLVLEKAIDQTRPNLVIIDPVTAFLGRTDSYKDSEVRGLLAPILRIIEHRHVALLAVAHLNKNQQRGVLYRVGGSIAFIAAARLAFAVGVDPEDEDRRILASLKSNISAPAPSLAFRLPEGYVQWEAAAVSLSAAELLAPAAVPRGHQALDEAEGFLRQQLADGAVNAQIVFLKAHEAGITTAALQRAKKELKVASQKSGFQNGWMWSLPSRFDPDDPPGPDAPPTLQ